MIVNENTIGREPITIVEIDQDFCSRSFGSSPCTAAIGTTGAIECFNTFKSCQDTGNYDRTTLTLKFVQPNTGFPKGEYYIPSLVSVSTVPSELSIGSSDPDARPLGKNSSINIVFKDHPFNDKLVDPYRANRTYDPFSQSTFWAKWLSRNPYYQNRPLRVRRGYVGQAIEDMKTHNYIIQRINGPDSGGKVTVVAQDILKLADDKRAQAPKPSTGKLDSSILAGATSLTLSPTGIGNSEYPASGTAIISNEIVTYTRSGDTVTLTARGQDGTEDEDHDADETFQQVKVYNSERVDLVVKDLLENFADVDSSYIPATDWATEASTYLAGFTLNAKITEPEGVTKLLSEIVQQCTCYIWWNEVDQEIKFRAIRPAIPDETVIKSISETKNIVKDSLKIERKTTERISQVWVYFGLYNPTESIDDASNHRRLNVTIDTDAETANEYGERRVNRIYSRWFSSANAGAANTASSRLLERYRDDPIYFTFSMDAKDRSILLGDVVEFEHRALVDFTGAPRVDVLQVVKITEKIPGHTYEYRCQAFGFAISGFGSRFCYIEDNAQTDYDNGSTTDADRNFGAFICDNSTESFPSDDGDAYRIV